MPIKIVKEIKTIGPGQPQNGVLFTQLTDMVRGFQKKPEGVVANSRSNVVTTKFVHFDLKNILELLIVNGIGNKTDTLEDLQQKDEYGLKVYFAQHMSVDDCPAGGEDYVGRNTVVLVTTKKAENSQKRIDMLDMTPGNENYIETTGFDSDIVGPGQGLDRTNLSPPQQANFPDIIIL